jgi:hypothetical protein
MAGRLATRRPDEERAPSCLAGELAAGAEAAPVGDS